MAITKILNIMGSEGRNPASHLKNALEYIQNPDKTEECVLVGSINCLPDTAFEQMEETKNSSTVAVVGNKGFIDPCTYEYEKHLGRHTSGEIYYKTALGKYMFYEMKLYLQRHQLIYNLGRVHAKLKEVKKEIDRREHVHKPTEDLTELYKELCVIFFEYYNAFSEEVE